MQRMTAPRRPGNGTKKVADSLQSLPGTNNRLSTSTRFHLLETIFNTMLEKNSAMSVSKAVAVELAFALELNNETAWADLTQREREYRRLLWWTVYIIDRRISIRTVDHI